MVSFQSEPTAIGASNTDRNAAVGKKTEAVELRDQLTGCLIGLARATEGNEYLLTDSTASVIVEGLCATRSDVNFDDAALQAIIERVDTEKRKLVPSCFICASPCGRTDAYDMRKLWNADADIRSLKSRILFGIWDIAACAHSAADLGYKDDVIHNFLYKALIVIGIDEFRAEDLLPIVQEMGEVKRKCMAMLDAAGIS